MSQFTPEEEAENTRLMASFASKGLCFLVAALADQGKIEPAVIDIIRNVLGNHANDANRRTVLDVKMLSGLLDQASANVEYFHQNGRPRN